MFSFLQTIGQECWQSSVLMTVAGECYPSAVTESHPAVAIIALMLCLVYFMIFMENSFFSIVISWQSLFNRIALEDALGNKNLIYAINNTVLLCIPLLALVLYFLDVTHIHFLFIFAALAATALLQMGLALLVGWLKQCPELMLAVGTCSRMHKIVFTTIALTLLALFWVTGVHSVEAGRIMLLLALAVLFILRAVRTYRLFTENNCSLLFWFLYLCTLEILPLGALICVLIKI